MAKPRRPVFGRWFAFHLRRLVRIYWRSPDARWSALLLAGAIALELGTVYANLLLSDAERLIFDALEGRHGAAFLSATGLFLGFSALFLFASTYRIYLRQLVEVRWRRGLTAHYLERWMGGRAYCQVALHPTELDNPDQRIQEDVRDFVASALGLSLSLLAALATLVSFGGLLWRLSATWSLPVGGQHLHIPGLLLWVAIAYAVLSTALTHWVGRRLVPINFDRLRREADFRYGLMRFRDHVETIVLSRGEELERRGSLGRFRGVMLNWWQLVAAQRNLSLLTTGIGQANSLVPILVAAPGYFAGLLTLGSIVQIRFAYGQVSGALNWFVYAYQEIARWRANIERLATFAEVMDATQRDLERAGVRVETGPASALRIRDLELQSREGAPLVARANASVAAGERVAIVGPSGSGKTTLLRAVAGIWPFGEGKIEVPAGAHMLFVPQRPYIPVGSLRAVLSFPAPEGRFSDDAIRGVLRLLGLKSLDGRLDESALWEEQLSPDEQQRVSIARVLLNEPEWVFLDKATSALDEDVEKRVYQILAQRLPKATLISVAHRPEVADYHARRWTLAPHDHGPATLQAA